MFKVLVLFAFVAYGCAQNDNCMCGYKFITKDVLLDPHYQYSRPRRWLEDGPQNNTLSNIVHDFDDYDDFTNDTTRPNGDVTFRRIGGEKYAKETRFNEFPMMAAIYKGDSKENGDLFAGGTIISSRYVLTAAHVLEQLKENQTLVVVGEHHRDKDLSPEVQKIKPAKFIIHKDYRQDIHDYDIAIIELEKEIKFSDRVGPVCLPFKFIGEDFAKTFGTYLGWGPQFSSGPVSDVLRKVDVQVLRQDTCRQHRSEMTERQMCTFAPKRDSCEYDSGGPLLYMDPVTRRLFIIGIISFGRSCVTNYPGFATRVTTLLDWIQEVAPAGYCRQPPRLQDSTYTTELSSTLAALVDATDYTILAPASVPTIDTVVTTARAIKSLVDRNRPAMVIFGKHAGINSNTPAIRAAKYMIHPDYDEEDRRGIYDIGIIKLEKNINKCLNQHSTTAQKSNPSNSQIQGSDWGLPLPTLGTAAAQWHINPDQCFNVSTLNDRQICERTNSEMNCDELVRSLLGDHVACPNFMHPPRWPQGYGPPMGPPRGPPMGPPRGPSRPKNFVPQPPQLCKKGSALPVYRGRGNQNFVGLSQPPRPMICCGPPPPYTRQCYNYRGEAYIQFGCRIEWVDQTN